MAIRLRHSNRLGDQMMLTSPFDGWNKAFTFSLTPPLSANARHTQVDVLTQSSLVGTLAKAGECQIEFQTWPWQGRAAEFHLLSCPVPCLFPFCLGFVFHMQQINQMRDG